MSVRCLLASTDSIIINMKRLGDPANQDKNGDAINNSNVTLRQSRPGNNSGMAPSEEGRGKTFDERLQTGKPQLLSTQASQKSLTSNQTGASLSAMQESSQATQGQLQPSFLSADTSQLESSMSASQATRLTNPVTGAAQGSKQLDMEQAADLIDMLASLGPQKRAEGDSDSDSEEEKHDETAGPSAELQNFIAECQKAA